MRTARLAGTQAATRLTNTRSAAAPANAIGSPPTPATRNIASGRVTNQAAVERIQQVFLTQVVPALAAVVPDRASLPTRAGLISTQLLGLALCRYALQIPPVVALKPDQIVRLIGPVLQQHLVGPIAMAA